jgi:hypothetical protein
VSEGSVVRELPVSLVVRPWVDAWREANGFGPHSAYVELVWSGRLGPTATLLYRRLGGVAGAYSDGATVDVSDLSAGLGVGSSAGRWSVLARSVARLVQFGAARWSEESLEVRRALPPVPPSTLDRLGPTARRVHDAELARIGRVGTPGQRELSPTPELTKDVSSRRLDMNGSPPTPDLGGDKGRMAI